MSTLRTTVKLKRSTTQGSAPSYESLAAGELAINQYDGKLFYIGNDSGDVGYFIDSDAIRSTYVRLEGGTLTGDLVVPATTGSSPNNAAATKAYVDAEINNVGVSDTPTGDYGLLSDPTEFDAFGQALFLTFDMLTTPAGQITITDLGSDSAI